MHGNLAIVYVRDCEEHNVIASMYSTLRCTIALAMISPLLTDLRMSLCPEDACVCRRFLTLNCPSFDDALSLRLRGRGQPLGDANMERLLNMRSSVRPWIAAWKQQCGCAQSLLSYGCSAGLVTRARRSLTALFSRSASSCSPRPEARDDERCTSGMLTDQMSV